MMMMMSSDDHLVEMSPRDLRMPQFFRSASSDLLQVNNNNNICPQHESMVDIFILPALLSIHWQAHY